MGRTYLPPHKLEYCDASILNDGWRKDERCNDVRYISSYILFSLAHDCWNGCWLPITN